MREEDASTGRNGLGEEDAMLRIFFVVITLLFLCIAVFG